MQFADIHMKEEGRPWRLLTDDGESWMVQPKKVGKNLRYTKLCEEWQLFAMQYRIAERDACLFELVEHGQKELRVTFFRERM